KNNIALALHRAHRDTEAGAAFDEGLQIAKDIDDTTAQAWLLNNHAYMLFEQGDLHTALELQTQKLELGGRRGDAASRQALAHAAIAEIMRLQGDLPGAHAHLDAADKLIHGSDARRFGSWVLEQRGEVERVEDHLAEAREHLEQALQLTTDDMA